MPTRSRPPAADVWLGAGLALASAVINELLELGPPYWTDGLLGTAIAAATALSLIWRQVHPMTVLCTTSVLLVLNSLAGYPTQIVQWPAWIALFTCYSLLGWWPRAVAATVALLAVLGYVLFDRLHAGAWDLSGIMVCFLVATIGGDTARSRRWALAAERERLAAHAREQAMRAERMVVQERRRLAGELHDALGHAVNVMVLQAGVGHRVFAENPQFAQEALRHIETVGRNALDELDRMLRILQPAESAPPDLADLTELAAQVRAAGRELDLDTGDVDLSASGARTVHRILQEAVTNALRHGGSGRIRVRLAQTGGEVRLEVANEGRDLPVPVPGRGLVNMRERARLEGGRFEAGPVADGFLVRAVLPARASAPVPQP